MDERSEMTKQLESRYMFVVLGIVGTAAGLNLSVLSLGDATAGEIPAAPATSTEPSVIQVEVDVTIPAIPTTTPAAPAAAPTPAPSAAPPQIVYVQVPAAPAPTQAPTTQPPTTPTSPAPTTTSAPATAAPTTPTTAGPVTEYLYYDFEGVASEIIVAFHDDRALEFWSATPDPGWSFQVEKDSARKVEVKFRRVEGAEGEAKFELTLEDGDLRIKKEL